MVGKKLYVGNLTYKVSSSDLEQLFSQFGTVQSAQVITDRDTGRSKGFGFVEMDTEAEAQEAIRGLHDQDHDGRRLTVNEARPREPRAGGGGGYGGGGGVVMVAADATVTEPFPRPRSLLVRPVHAASQSNTGPFGLLEIGSRTGFRC